jgi:beta-glucosidase
MRKFIIFLLGCFLVLGNSVFGQESFNEAKLKEIIAKMSLDEKIAFIGGIDGFNIRAVKDLGIPTTRMADGPVGVRNYGPSTAYPTSVLLAASWDTDMANKIGAAIGMESKAKNVHIMLGPGMNIYRAPMNGRNFEYLGEDPYLAGKIASNYIVGLQKQGVMATAKHFIANFQEYNRHHVSSDMDERTMQEIYLPAFKACVQEGKVASVMTSYNLINGVHASQHDQIINKILKGDWGFEGFVMSDWTSVYDGVAAANAGLDLEMPSGIHMCKDSLIPAIKAGKLAEKTIDDKIFRILKQYARFGYFDNAEINKGYILDSVWVRDISIEAARGGLVLLKNENNFLPLNKAKIKSIALIGPNADPVVSGGGGSALVKPLHPLSLYESLAQAFDPDVKINLQTGIFGQELRPVDFYTKPLFYTYIDGKQAPGLTAEFYKKHRPEGSSDYQTTIPVMNRIFGDSVPGIPRNRSSARFTGYLKVEKSGTYNFIVSSDGGYRLMVDDKQIIGGSWNVSAESVKTGIITLEAGKEYKISLTYNMRKPTGILRMAYETPDVYNAKLAKTLENISKAAKESDVVILSVGFNAESEHEGGDRDYKLSEDQQRIINEVIKTNKDFMVVLNAGGNVDMLEWLPKTKALLHAWYPGQEGNKAVAEVLLGITNPSGKLPASFEKRWEENPTYKSYYDTDKHVKFTEGIFVGYRHYDKNNVEPLFPFGFGLSYTTFEYSNLTISKAKIKSNEEVEVKLTVKNTGNVDGAEIVQIYVADLVSSYPRPVKELKSFSKVWLKKGESKEISFKLNSDAFQYFNPDTKKWFVEPGDFDIIAATSSKDIRLKKIISVTDK